MSSRAPDRNRQLALPSDSVSSSMRVTHTCANERTLQESLLEKSPSRLLCQPPIPTVPRGHKRKEEKTGALHGGPSETGELQQAAASLPSLTLRQRGLKDVRVGSSSRAAPSHRPVDKSKGEPGMAAHTCPPRTPGGCTRGIASLSPAWATWQLGERALSQNKKGMGLQLSAKALSPIPITKEGKS